MKKIFLLIMISFLLSGCTAEYNLNISDKGFSETLILRAENLNDNELLIEYPITAFYDSEGNNEDPLKKESGVEYYNSKLIQENNLNKLTYNYNFSENEILLSRIIRNSFSTVIFKKYDHDEDGKNDYMLISTTDDFSGFKYENLSEVVINIRNDYKVISSNADKINGNIYTWVFNKDSSKAINMVYDPSIVIDNRTTMEKFDDSNYILGFIFIFLLIILVFVVLIFKKYSNLKDKI